MSESVINCIPCEKCDGTGWLEYEVDYFGRKTQWGRCNAPGCVNGQIEIEVCAQCGQGEDLCKCDQVAEAA